MIYEASLQNALTLFIFSSFFLLNAIFIEIFIAIFIEIFIAIFIEIFCPSDTNPFRISLQ